MRKATLYFTPLALQIRDMPPSKPKPAPKTNESKLAKLGLHTDMDLVLHLPMRYEDETQVIADPRGLPARRPRVAGRGRRYQK